MKIIIYILLFALPFVSKSQNWLPINPNEKYNFSLDNNHISNTLWIDSVVGNYYYINRIITKCPQCPLPYNYASEMFLKNQEQFLGSHFTISQDEIIFLDSNNSLKYRLKLSILLNTNFIFDSVNQIGCKLVEKKDSLIFNVLDSIKKFQLSNGDEIILSRTFGMLKFPKFGSNQYYTLVGLQNQNLGKQVPNFSQFTKLNINDEFEYIETFGSRWLDRRSYQKIKILRKIGTFTPSYLVQTKEMNYQYSYGTLSDSTYSYYLDTLVLNYNLISYLDFYPNTPLNINQCGLLYKPVLLGYDSVFECVIKYFDPLKIYLYSGDTLYSTFLYGQMSGCSTHNYQLVFGEGIGLINMNDNENYSYPYNHWSNRTLIAAKVKGNIYGSFSLNKYEDDEPFDQIKIFPNPTSGLLYYDNVSTGISLENYEIIDTYGNVIKKGLIYKLTSPIDVSDLHTGIYLIRFNSTNSFTAKKFVLLK